MLIFFHLYSFGLGTNFQLLPNFLTTQQEIRDLLVKLVERQRNGVDVQRNALATHNETIDLLSEGVIALRDHAQSQRENSEAMLALPEHWEANIVNNPVIVCP